MSQKNNKAARRVDQLEAKIGELVQEVHKLKADRSQLMARVSSGDISAGILKSILAIVLQNNGQRRAFFSKRALDKARQAVATSVSMASRVMTDDERAALVEGELKYQVAVKQAESRLILPEGVAGLPELYTPEARAEAEAWVDRGIIVELKPREEEKKTGSTFTQDPKSIDPSEFLKGFVL